MSASKSSPGSVGVSSAPGPKPSPKVSPAPAPAPPTASMVSNAPPQLSVSPPPASASSTNASSSDNATQASSQTLAPSAAALPTESNSQSQTFIPLHDGQALPGTPESLGTATNSSLSTNSVPAVGPGQAAAADVYTNPQGRDPIGGMQSGPTNATSNALPVQSEDGFVPAGQDTRPSQADPFSLFAFGSVTATTALPFRGGVESVALAGFNSDSGFFGGTLSAGGIEAGGEVNYVAAFEGTEALTSGEVSGITMVEHAFGVEVPGVAGVGVGFGIYFSGGESGFFFFVEGGVIGEYGAVGFGVGSGSR